MRGQRIDGVAHVLELDPELGEGLAEAEFETACAVLRSPLVSVPAGRFDPASASDGRQPFLGLLIFDGIVCREVRLRDQRLVELLGPGDVIQRPSRELEALPLGGPTVTVVSELLATELGGTFLGCATKWPGLMTGLLDRLETQHQRLVAQELIVHLRRADERLLLMFWLLGNRWGHVTMEGIHVPLSLTHALLGQLIAARRSTVTLALRGLAEHNLLKRLPAGGWILTSRAADAVERVARATRGPVFGDTLRLRQRATELQNDATALRASARLLAAKQPARTQ